MGKINKNKNTSREEQFDFKALNVNIAEQGLDNTIEDLNTYECWLDKAETLNDMNEAYNEMFNVCN